MPQRRASFVLFVLFVVLSFVRPVTGQELGVRVPDGFEVTLFADDDLAHDIFSLTVDSLGRVVVSGPGYVRILLDRDGDGRADGYQQYADGPKTGAQGLCFDGRDLICTGDAGLIRYRDANADDRADGPPETLLKIKAGGEHHAHAVQRGPDGWWYVMAGNMAGVTEKDITTATSPVRRPRAGVLLRLTPDFSGCEVVAHGFRNAYDFAFNAQGDIFTYDSDGEREVSLPWYRPTRVFHVLPGSDAGWLSETWKHPDYFPDMPPVIASLGRGSPTGVLCYRHEQFPAEYRGALFVADWTFGRIVALPLVRDGETWKTKPKDFMTGSGTFGFAPTDMEVAPDGSMYVSVGGRGTRGGVYRVRYKDAGAAAAKGSPSVEAKTVAASDLLSACLSAPQPLSSWSRAGWLPVAELGREILQKAVLDAKRPIHERRRSIEVLTELFGGLDDVTVTSLMSDASPELRAAAAWSLGRTKTAAQVGRFIEDSDPVVVRVALDAVQGRVDKELLPALARTLGCSRPIIGSIARRWVSVMPKQYVAELDAILVERGFMGKSDVTAEPRLFHAMLSHESLGKELVGKADLSLSRLAPDLRLERIRAYQVVFGDVGPGGHPPAFDAYAKPGDTLRRRGSGWSAPEFPTGDEPLDKEFSRLAAILGSENPTLLDQTLKKITRSSHPTDDVHYLFVASRNFAKRSDGDTERVAQALIQLDEKVARLKLSVDTNWEPSISALYQELVHRDPALPWDVVRHPKFGRAEHVVFTKNLPAELLPVAIAAFERRIREESDFPVTADLVFLLGKSAEPRHVDLVRRLYDERLAVRGAALAVLAKRAEAVDRPKFVAGLDEAEPEVLEASLEALAKLPSSNDAKEQVTLLRALRRLSGDAREYTLRDKAASLLRRAWNEDFGFVSGKAGHRPQPQAITKWTDFLRRKFPEEFSRQTRSAAEADVSAINALLAQADWSRGDAARGARLFEARSCSRCHSGRTALGPDLAGATRRFSRDDLFTAIVEPSRDVSPRYQSTMIQTTDGKTYSGLVIYESVDGVTLRDGLNQTIRIDGSRIEARRKLPASLMPSGLLKDLKPGDLADLYAYLQSIGPK